MKPILTELMALYQHLSDYGETKLGAAIAFSSALIVGILAVIQNVDGWLFYYLIGVIAINVFSLFFSFCGVFAINIEKHNDGDISDDINFYYYKDVSKIDPCKLHDAIQVRYDLNDSLNPKHGLDMSLQIVVLAKVAERKFRYFNVAINFIIASIITPIGLLIFYLINSLK